MLTVIGRDQLERNSGKSLADILNTVSGTTMVGSSSNLGTNVTASIRGGSAGNVLVLINGVPVNDPSVNDNYFDLNFINPEEIERVEVMKGGHSTLYGSDAVTGVINIITRKAGKYGVYKDFFAAAGLYGTYKVNAGIRQSSQKSQLSVQYGLTTSNGFSSSNDSTGNQNYDKDGFIQHNITGSWSISLAKKLKSSLFAQYSWYKTGIDGSAFSDDKDYNVTTDNLSAGAGLSYEIPQGSVQLNYRFNNVNRLYLNDSADKAPDYLRVDYNGKTHYVELYANRSWQKIEVLAGIDYRRNSMSSDLLSISMFGPYSSSLGDSLAKMSQLSPYASVVLKPTGIINVEVGGRLNHHSKYGNNFSYTISPSVLLNERLKLFVNLYSAFKTPTLFQLFDPTFGNTNLDPEESFNIESGAQWFLTNNFNFRAVYFYRKTDHAIEFIYTDPANFVSQYRNVSKKTARGIELEGSYKSEKWNVSANYTHTKAQLTSSYDNTGFPAGKDSAMNNLYRTPADVFNASGGIQITPKIYAGSALRIAGERLEPVYGAAPKTLAGYYTLDFYGEYIATKNIKVFADFRNVTNREYVEILGYNTRGFNFMAGARLSF